jgi:UPF0755 protein
MEYQQPVILDDKQTATSANEVTSASLHKRLVSRPRVTLFVFFLFLTLPVITLWALTRPPSASAHEVTVSIPRGISVRGIAVELKEAGIIRSPQLFTLLAKWNNVDTLLAAGTYKFQTPLSLFAVQEQMSAQDFGLPRVKITIPEGTTLSKIGDMCAQKFPDFNKDVFMHDATNREGYLFPDTYFFFANATSGTVVETLAKNFDAKTREIKSNADALGKSWDDIVTMASLIEGEAAREEDRHIVSGILWNRLDKGMKLQVDAPFLYVLGKASSEITHTDLDSDSPYNTYRHSGLPPTPISNPGLDALDAALHPTPTTYVYYLSDKSGAMHYATTFAEHRRNKERYLY